MKRWSPSSPRSPTAPSHSHPTIRAHGIPAEPQDTVAAAVAAGVRTAKEKGEPLIILGSLYTYKDVYRLFK